MNTLTSSALAAAARNAAEETASTKLKDRIKKLLIANVKPSEIVKSLGVDPSYISQLLSDENFAGEVLEGRATSAALRGSLNERYDKIEDTLLQQLEAQAAIPMNAGMLLRALQVVGQKKREPVLPNPEAEVKRVVHLHLAPRALEKFVIDGNRNVVGIGERSFAPMPSTELLKEVKALEKTSAPLENKDDSGREKAGGAKDSASPRSRSERTLDQSNPEEI